MPSGVIIYYIVGPVHLQNMQLVAQEMPEWEFRIAYEANVPWFNRAQMKALTFDAHPVSGDRIPAALWSGDVRAIVFSATQLRNTPVSLFRESLIRNIPSLAIEESIQVALNSGRINNYLLSLDEILVSSEHERAGMIAEGVRPECVQVTGWPFYTGRMGKIASDRMRDQKARFGFDADRPVASLTLTALGDAGESPAVRRRQLAVAASGLPEEYQLVVKPHPIETLESLEPYVREFAPQAKVIPGDIRILELLQATDVLLNRGVSQVCFEALLQEIPVVILDTGIQTPFHGLVPEELIVKEAADVPRALESINDADNKMRIYEAFMAAHLPYTPPQARKLTCARIAKAADHAEGRKTSERQWFDLALYQAWLQQLDEALSILDHCRSAETGAGAEALSRLIHYRATPTDQTALRQFAGPGFRQAILQSLWIRQLAAQRKKPAAQDLEWLQSFPPTTNTSWFIPLARQWAWILIRTREMAALRVFCERLEREFTQEPDLAILLAYLKGYQEGLLGRLKYYTYRFDLALRAWTRPARSAIGILFRKLRRIK